MRLFDRSKELHILNEAFTESTRRSGRLVIVTGGPGSGARFPQLIEASALKRAGQPEEVAAAIAFLASDDASYVTGETLNLNGGMPTP